MSRLRIVVGGYIVGLPLAGMTWHHLHYLLGLHRLGHEVTFLEDSGPWASAYNPVKHVMEADPSYGIAYLESCFDHVGLPKRYCYVSRHTGPGELAHFGMDEAGLHDALRSADLYIAVSGVTPWHDSRPRPRRTLGIDTDPVYTQLKMSADAEFDAYWRGFDRLASFGTQIGQPDCLIPDHGLQWFPTRQPVVLDQWPTELPSSEAAFTTLGKWEHASDRYVMLRGRSYLSSKAPGWRIAADLPAMPNMPGMTLAMSNTPAEDQADFSARGWRFMDPTAASLSLLAFNEFIRDSLGEFTPAKDIYVELPSGWFSDRAACYLASGRPVVTQATGFDIGPLALPVGEGLFAWRTADDAAAALRAVTAHPARHSVAARRIAEAHLDADQILPSLLDFALG